jgi:hypothetical protein
MIFAFYKNKADIYPLGMPLQASPGKMPLRVGCGAGFSGDRWDAAVPVVKALANYDGASVLMFETLAERTLALAQLSLRNNSDSGWEPCLERFVAPVLRQCVESRIPIVGNFGAANPRGAARRLQLLAAQLGLKPLRIAVVHGDDLMTALTPDQLESVVPPSMQGKRLVSANAYLGAEQIAQALKEGAQVVVTGRVADAALALGPLLAHFEWAPDDWDRVAAGTIAGHVLECGAQATGGYFADPGRKDVPDVAHVGFPIVEMHEDGRFVVTKPPGTGGIVSRRTVIEQLLYEVHDPCAYLSPDVIADLGETEVTEIGADRVEVRGVRGHPRPATLKSMLCYEGGWLAEGEISYAGDNAAARAQLAGEIVRDRLRGLGLAALPLRRDLIGVASVFADDAGRWNDGAALFPGASAAPDVRLRVAAATTNREDAEIVVREVLALYTCGPAGGGGVRSTITQRLGSESCLIERELLKPGWSFVQ